VTTGSLTPTACHLLVPQDNIGLRGVLSPEEESGDAGGVSLFLYMRILSMKLRLREVILESVRKHFGKNTVLSYSQEGEDMILRRIFENQSRGFYVEVGAPHPIRFSNSYYFYTLGWSGINIEPTPGAMSLFHILRPRDINLEAAVSRKQETRDFFLFDEPSLNTFDRDLAREWESRGYRMIETQRIMTRPLADILAEHVPEGTKIDFLSIDIEGMDFEALQSNDWKKYRPRILLVEMHGVRLDDAPKTEMYRYLQGMEYELFAKSVLTFLFRDNLSS
jgi:FkbM family methyltransferase